MPEAPSLTRRMVLAEGLLLQARILEGTELVELHRTAIDRGGPLWVLAELEQLLDQHGLADRYRAGHG